MKETALLYFVIQSIGSLLYLTWSSLRGYTRMEVRDNVSILALTLKSGLYPLQFWILTIIEFIRATGVTLILGPQKVPVYLIMFRLGGIFLLWLAKISFFWAAVKINLTRRWAKLMLWSSIYSMIWIIIIYQFRGAIYMVFFFIYTICLYMFCKRFEIKGKGKEIQSRFLIFSFFVGLPPLSIFFFKVCLMNFGLSWWPRTTIILLWLGIFMASIAYTKIMMANFCLNQDLWKRGLRVAENKKAILVTLSLRTPQFFIFKSKLL